MPVTYSTASTRQTRSLASMASTVRTAQKGSVMLRNLSDDYLWQTLESKLAERVAAHDEVKGRQQQKPKGWLRTLVSGMRLAHR
jgi:hypothetical protein